MRATRLGLVAILAVCCWRCGEPLEGLDDTTDPAPNARTITQAIVNGTDEPLITDLTEGERRAIGFLADPSGAPFCSGTLIRPDVVLTARHCVTERRVEDIRFGVGQPAAPEALVGVKRLSESDWEADVALLQLKSAPGREVVGVTAIPFNHSPLTASFIGTQVEIAGYHAVDGISRRRFAVLEVTNLLDKAIVADGFGARGACQGDSGGPLLIHDASGNPVVAGTIMGGHNSCLENVYFGRIDALTAWIAEEIQWFSSADGGTGSGSSQGSRRIPDPCACSPVHTNLDGWSAALAVLVLALVLWPRRRRDATRR